MNYKTKAIQLFVDHTNYKKEDIKHISQIHNGFTNISFKITTNKNKIYQVRLGNDNKTIKRLNEFNILKLVKDKNYVYFNKNNGNAIKKWINGVHPDKKTLNTQQFVNILCRAINKMHNTKLQNYKILKHNYLDCIDKATLDNKHKTKYLELIQKHKTTKFVLSHNDLSADNLLWNNNKIIFIDYEWSRLNNPYWDIANFIRETNLSLKFVLYIAKYFKCTEQTLKDFIYIATNYAYQWTFNMQLTTKIKGYRKLMFKRMNMYYKLFY